MHCIEIKAEGQQHKESVFVFNLSLKACFGIVFLNVGILEKRVNYTSIFLVVIKTINIVSAWRVSHTTWFCIS